MPRTRTSSTGGGGTDLFEVVASIGVRHTSTADRAWFAVWDGHGFETGTTHIAWQGPLDDSSHLMLEQERSRLRGEDDRRNAAVREALSEVPRFELPHRTHYLLTGPVRGGDRIA